MFTIARLMTGAVALLGLAWVSTLGSSAWVAWREAERARIEAEEVLAAANFGIGLGKYLTERQWTLNALGRDAPASPQERQGIERARSEARAGMEGAAPVITRVLAGSPRQATVSAMMGALPGLREEGDRMAAAPRSARDAAAISRFSNETRRHVVEASEAWLRALPAMAGRDAALARHTEVMALIWRLRDTSGLARAAISAALVAGQVPDEAARTRIFEWAAGARLLWVQLEGAASSGSLAPEIARAVVSAKAAYDAAQGYEGLLREVAAAWAAGRPASVSGTVWVESTNQVFDAVLAVMEAAKRGATSLSGEAAARARSSLIWQMALAVGGTVFVGLVILLIQRRIVRPLGAVVGVVGRLAAGERGVAVPGAARRDEVGELSRAVAAFQRQLEAGEKLAAEAEAERTAARARQDEALRSMADRIEQETRTGFDQIGGRMRQVLAEADQVTAGAEAMSTEGSAAGQAAGDALSATETVAAATEEMAASIREITRRMAEAAELTQNAVRGTEAGTATIRGLSDAVTRIGTVAQLISDIAGRTNLLALNATIEAARAGEAGKGFAVVASEVKALASQTAKATEEIGGQIAAVQAETTGAVEAIDRIAQTVAQLREIATAVAAAMEQQSATTAEIARSVAGTAESTRGAADRMVTLGRGAEDAARRAVSVRDAASQAEASLEEVRNVLVRAVREAAEAVERRSHPRAALVAPVTLLGPHGREEARLIDLAPGGAAIEPGSKVTPGMAVTLEVMGLALRGRVLECDAKRTRIAFAEDAAQARQVKELMARLKPAAA
jgi:methyl-accepting chemotaxis protein